MTTTPFAGTAPLIIRRFGWFSVASSFVSFAIADATFFGAPVAAPPGNIEFTATVWPASRPKLVVPVFERATRIAASSPGGAIFSSLAVRIGRTSFLRGKLCFLRCAFNADTSIFISRTSSFQSGTMVSARFFQPQSSSLCRSQGLKNVAASARNVNGAASTKLAMMLAMNRTFVKPAGSSFFFEPGAFVAFVGFVAFVASVAFVALVAFVASVASVVTSTTSSTTSGSANTYAAPATPSATSVPTARPSRSRASDVPKKP